MWRGSSNSGSSGRNRRDLWLCDTRGNSAGITGICSRSSIRVGGGPRNCRTIYGWPRLADPAQTCPRSDCSPNRTGTSTDGRGSSQHRQFVSCRIGVVARKLTRTVQPQAQAHFYDQVWTADHVWNPRVWPEWDVISPILENCPRRLEIGPGTRPRLPISGSWFVDVSQVALSRLQGHGCSGILANANALPFPDCQFDLVASCELLEHIEDDQRAVAELARVTYIGGF